MNRAAKDDQKVNRAVATLARWKNVRINGDLLVSLISTKRLPCSRGDIHRLWPRIEQELLETHKLYAIRPLAHLAYATVATDDQRLVLAQKRARNQYVGTMLSRDVNERRGILADLLDSPNGRWAASAARALERDEAWLASRARGEAEPLEDLIDAAVTEVTHLPYLHWDGHRLEPVAVGANGLPINGSSA